MGRRGRGGRGDDRRKDLQLCAQVRRTLDLALAEASDERLLGAWVREVLPNPDVGRLRVVVEVGPEVDPDEVLGLLNAAQGHLRAEVAGAIHRKRTPDLMFQVVPRESGAGSREP
ncbi:MAG TPA: ribosome-binding factor A [Polyangiaceae bacterium LLY-WYZ-15_(1-7)]|nr:hypothetical protein [Sandaracinus sp.]HJL04894.1 ribosome-binding factor A [Polyangiaceae bacterium LLY-WYZ-15_(1-7)]HJL08751.1 ribosome-binding factor A [Polyangiaceae bacterium LLY-WYZ-15_(1-7)]HJL20600.1 ribosome-binding factor A [Polyangiaceae bacterium LLY-WYZ-15_(1-7)]HJL33737.1 ribosome-binding factor A [Polyangiaceae bacterium LLY-WYZ-15_(1-7)]